MEYKKMDVYKCERCGVIASVLHDAKGHMVCCGQDMVKLTENTTDAATEKHVPVIEREGNRVTVKVGSVLHPMTDGHYIEWIELVEGSTSHLKYLNPGEEPVAVFNVEGADIYARAYCNLHGFWKS